MGEAPVVVALGGNAIAPFGARETLRTQYQRTQRTAEHLVHLSEGERPLLLTHGNGPQVGESLLRSEAGAATGQLPRLPLDALVADTQGRMGFMLQQCLDNALQAAGMRRSVAALLTRTVVNPADPAFGAPSKPIGDFYDEAAARRHMAADGWVMREDAGRGWRRVVPSPQPHEVLEEGAIRALLTLGVIVVAAGGGGIPVVRQPDGSLTGVEAVVDKDLTAALLATQIGADTLLILTGVDHVALDFGRPTQRDLHEVSAAELAAYAAAGQFPPGSMLPKIQAALTFLAQGGQRAIITTPELSEKALTTTTGTQVTR
ncbi:MAG TPA: carbamate kinase [Actinomycetota bacterium]